MEAKEYEVDLREYFQIIRKRAWVIVLVTVIAVSLSGILSYYVLQPVYEAFTTLIVSKPSDEEAIIQYSDVLLSQKLVKTYGEILKSRKVSKQVIKNLNLNISSEQLKQKITVTPVNDTEIVQIKVIDTNPELAQSIANELAEVFINDVKRIMNIDNVQVIDRAESPLEPSKPKPRLNMLIGGFMGMIVGLGVIFLLEYLDNTIKTSDDIEKHLALNVLGTIPYIDKKAKKSKV